MPAKHRCRLGSQFLKDLLIPTEVPASSAIVTATEEVPQVQDLEVDLSKIDLAELVWGWEAIAKWTWWGHPRSLGCIKFEHIKVVRFAKALCGSIECLAPLFLSCRRSCPTALKESYVCRPESTRRPGLPMTGPGWWGLLSDPGSRHR